MGKYFSFFQNLMSSSPYKYEKIKILFQDFYEMAVHTPDKFCNLRTKTIQYYRNAFFTKQIFFMPKKGSVLILTYVPVGVLNTT